MGADSDVAHRFAGTLSGQDRYWTSCGCGWESRRSLSTEQAYEDWLLHRADAVSDS